ncbi:MAG: hypothetical protein MUF64_21095 [Polyangiaceae bacterium]|jgi:hypothetical protein|nr:hypothetical protein [Polyangiaceae bacterium]
MKYGHGFLTLLGASALSIGLMVGCGGEDDPAPAGAGGTSGLAGTGGIAGIAGTGGSAGAAAGTGGSAGAAAGTGGSAGAAAGTGGSAGAAAGTAGAGGSAAGTGGTGGSGGSGGSGGGAAGLDDMGIECVDDSDCGGGYCIREDGPEYGNGLGPANGICAPDCSAWLALSEEEQEKAVYPCDPGYDIANATELPKALCLRYSEDGQPLKGYCTQLCEFGSPEFQGLVSNLGQAAGGKCQNRADMACNPRSNQETGDFLGFSLCSPMCSSDDQCNDGRSCDRQTGLCTATKNTKKKNGELCTVTADPEAEGECDGLCLRLYDADDPTVPEAKKNRGICFDLCSYGTLESCGGISKGLCAFGLIQPQPVNEQGEPVGEPISPSYGDLGACAKNSPLKKDTDCAWQEGWFYIDAPTVGNPCIPAQECETLVDCASCESDNQCPQGAKCEQGTCKTNGQVNPGNQKCIKVPEVCGKSFCLDHEPKGLPANDPLVVCDSGAAGAGAGGAGGAAAGAGGAAAGAGGAAAGAGGAAAGAGGAAAGAGGAAAGAAGGN